MRPTRRASSAWLIPSFASRRPIRSPSKVTAYIYNFAYNTVITVFLLTLYRNTYSSDEMFDASSPLSALKRAVAIVGGQAAMARKCGVSQPTVWGWIHRMGQAPAEQVLGIEAATGIPKEDLRPDIYPRDVVSSTASGDDAARGGAGGGSSTPSRADRGTSDSLSGLSA